MEKETITAGDVGTIEITTRADRLNALCTAYAKGSTYEIFSVGVVRRIVVTDPETGDRVGVVGTDMDDAIAKLAKKIGTGRAPA